MGQTLNTKKNGSLFIMLRHNLPLTTVRKRWIKGLSQIDLCFSQRTWLIFKMSLNTECNKLKGNSDDSAHISTCQLFIDSNLIAKGLVKILRDKGY